MNAERWKQVDDLLQSVLCLPLERREEFLRQACGGDFVLEKEVKSLLDSHREAGDFLETPAVQLVAQAMALKEVQAAVGSITEGQTISHYRVLRKLGSGGMGVVYEAEDTRLRRRVALKFLSEPLAGDNAALERFQREARTASALNHPNICTVYDIDQSEGLHFIAIEFLEGETLKERLARPREFARREIFTIASEICHALEAAHSAGIIHRDIKPANIFITRQGTVKVLDFGVAKQLSLLMVEQSTRPLSSAHVFDDRSTDPGATVGTVGYMSPEQANSQHVDARTDIFSLGAVLYEMTTGVQPFLTRNSAADVLEIQDGNPRPISELNPGASPDLCHVIEKAMQTDPSLRYQHAKDLRVDLQAAEARSQTRRAKQKMAFAFALISVLLLIGFALFRVPSVRERIAGQPSSTSARKINSLAVLPLENLTGDASQEYFADGMTDELITELAELNSVRVISRTSVMQYKGAQKPLRQIANELSVDAILEGSVLRSGQHVRVTAQLIDAATDQHLWARTYYRELGDVLLLQSDMAGEIAREIRAEMNGNARPVMAQVSRVDPEEHDLYFRGRYHLSKGSEDEINKGIEYFRQGIERSPRDARNYAALADSYLALSDYYLSPAATLELGKQAAMQALQLDDNLAETHVSLGAIRFLYDWDWPQAEKEFRQAVKLNPNSSDAHLWRGVFLAQMGRSDEGISEIKLAESLDPLSLAVHVNAGWVYYLAKRDEQAVQEWRKILDIDPHFTVTHASIWIAYVKQAEMGTVLSPPSSVDADALQLAAITGRQAVSGNRAEAERLLSRLDSISKRHYVCPYEMATAHAILGNKDKALDWLSRGLKERSACMPDLKVDPRLDSLRSDARFQEFLRRVGFQK